MTGPTTPDRRSLCCSVRQMLKWVSIMSSSNMASTIPSSFSKAKKVHEYLRSLKDTQWSPDEYLARIQTRKLRGVNHIRESQSCLLSEDTFKMLFTNIVRPRIHCNLPLLLKVICKAHQSQFVRLDGRRGLARKTTGGSTGQAVTVWKTADAIAYEHAANWRGFEWAGSTLATARRGFGV